MTDLTNRVEYRVDVAEANRDAPFRPDLVHRQYKARLLVALRELGVDAGLNPPNPDQVFHYVPDRRLAVWFQIPGFRDWLCDTLEAKARIELLSDLAADAAQEILQNQDPKAQSARASMVKTVMELADKFPTSFQSKDGALKGLDKLTKEEIDAELAKFAAKRGTTLPAGGSGE